MLSTLLCSLYLGALEAQHLQPLLPSAAPEQHVCAVSSASTSSARLTSLAAAADGMAAASPGCVCAACLSRDAMLHGRPPRLLVKICR